MLICQLAGPETNGLIHFSFGRSTACRTCPKYNKNIATMAPPSRRLPAAPSFRGKCDHRTLRDRSRPLLSGDVIFIDESNKFLTLLTIILCAEAGHARAQKVSFLSDSLDFFVASKLQQQTLTLTPGRYPFFCNPPGPHHVLA